MRPHPNYLDYLLGFDDLIYQPAFHKVENFEKDCLQGLREFLGFFLIGRSLIKSHFYKNNLAIILHEMGHLADFISSYSEFGY